MILVIQKCPLKMAGHSPEFAPVTQTGASCLFWFYQNRLNRRTAKLTVRVRARPSKEAPVGSALEKPVTRPHLVIQYSQPWSVLMVFLRRESDLCFQFRCLFGRHRSSGAARQNSVRRTQRELATWEAAHHRGTR